MKIYNKKGFISGIAGILICIGAVAALFLKGFSIKLAVISPILFLISITQVKRSLSKTDTKEDLTINNDERDKYILLKTAKKSLSIISTANIFILFLSMISYAVTKNSFLLGVVILSSFYLTFMFIVELSVNIYYEKHE